MFSVVVDECWLNEAQFGLFWLFFRILKSVAAVTFSCSLKILLENISQRRRKQFTSFISNEALVISQCMVNT